MADTGKVMDFGAFCNIAAACACTDAQYKGARVLGLPVYCSLDKVVDVGSRTVTVAETITDNDVLCMVSSKLPSRGYRAVLRRPSCTSIVARSRNEVSTLTMINTRIEVKGSEMLSCDSLIRFWSRSSAPSWPPTISKGEEEARARA